jgi:hypothetical protein
LVIRTVNPVAVLIGVSKIGTKPAFLTVIVCSSLETERKLPFAALVAVTPHVWPTVVEVTERTAPTIEHPASPAVVTA